MLTVCCGRNWAEAIGTGERCLPGDPDDCGDGGKAAEARLSYPKGRLLPAILSSDPDSKICPNLDPNTSLFTRYILHFEKNVKKQKIRIRIGIQFLIRLRNSGYNHHHPTGRILES